MLITQRCCICWAQSAIRILRFRTNKCWHLSRPGQLNRPSNTWGRLLTFLCLRQWLLVNPNSLKVKNRQRQSEETLWTMPPPENFRKSLMRLKTLFSKATANIFSAKSSSKLTGWNLTLNFGSNWTNHNSYALRRANKLSPSKFGTNKCLNTWAKRREEIFNLCTNWRAKPACACSSYWGRSAVKFSLIWRLSSAFWVKTTR